MKDSDKHALLFASGVLGGLVLGTGAVALATWRSTKPGGLPAAVWQTGTYSEADVEAGARMLASENPTGSRWLHSEQVHTQLRSRRGGESLFDRITAGSGFGRQGERASGGGVRPVSTEEAASDARRRLVREVLEGMLPSALPGARKFFEPRVQDLAVARADQARKKARAGLALTPQEQRLLGYRRSAEEVRRIWRQAGAQQVGVIEGVEFFT